MTEIKFQFKGWQAILASVILLAVVGFRYITLWEDLKPDQLGILRHEISQGYIRTELPRLEEALDSGDVEATDRASKDALIRPEDVEIKNVAARGSFEDLIVRVEIRFRGQRPPDGKDVRYFKMDRSMLLGWRIVREVSSWQYYVRMW